MSRRLRQAAVVFIIVFAAAQLVRPSRTNPATDASRSIQSHAGTESGLVAVLDRACGDCHMTVYGEPSERLLDLFKAHSVGHTWFCFLEELGPSPVMPPVILGAERETRQPV